MNHSYARLRDLFERCLDVPDGERAAWLEANVADIDQRIELELMLAADCHEGFLGRDVVSHIGQLGAHGVDDETDMNDAQGLAAGLVGRRFGPFELRHLLGMGGQGAVYLAERVGDDFHQTVAIKLLRRGIHEPQEHRRFRREREILANFEHPGVARLIDGGVSDDGVPYLAMEYVDGRPIDAWCEEHHLARDARLRLFSELCNVVSAAQRALIVHRDLKPSNVLVTGGGIKVLDFGIARLLDEGDSADRTHVPLMTPGYGAPEQATCGPITLSTDVYALGVLLRVLLTGENPSGDPRFVERSLPHDLAPELRWILGKACASEPERRYRDAAELDDDVRRFLGARPVLAHPPSRRYRLRKFMQRHRGSMLVTAAMMLGILASLGISLWQAKVAREQAQRAEAVRDFLLSIFEAAKIDLPKDARPTPDVLARAAAKKIESDTALKPDMRAEFLTSLGEIARKSDDFEGAVVFYDKALQALDSNGDVDSKQRLHVEIFRAWAFVTLGRPEETVKALQPRLAGLRAEQDANTVDALWAYAQAREDTGHVEEALALVREARVIAMRIFPMDTADSLSLSLAYGDALTSHGDIREAKDVLQSTIERWRAVGIPEQYDYMVAIANLGWLQRRLGDGASAERLTRDALEISHRINPGPGDQNALLLEHLGRLLAERGDYDEAEVQLQESAKMISGLFEPQHPFSIGALGAQGALAYERQRYAEAATVLQRSRELCDAAKLDGETRCITNLQMLADALLRLGRVDEAAVASARSIELRRKLVGETGPDYANALRATADVALARGDYKAALDGFDAALAIDARAGVDANLDVASILSARARAQLAQGQPGEALQSLDRAEAITARLAERNSGRRLRLLATRVATLSSLSRTDEAVALARKAIALEPVSAVLDPSEWQRLLVLAR